MFGPNDRGPLSNELLLMIFTDPCLEYTDLFRFTVVNRKWHSFISEWNEIRALMFLPCLEPTKNPVIRSSSLTSAPVLRIRLQLPYRDTVECRRLDASKDQQAILTDTPWGNARIHPLLLILRTHQDQAYRSRQQVPVQPDISYQLLKHCSKKHFKNEGATWRQMLVTQPPLESLSLNTHYLDCVDPQVLPESMSIDVLQGMTIDKHLQNHNGVTIGDVFDAAWQTRLPRNAGLVPDIERCDIRYRYRPNTLSCHCFHETRHIEKDYYQRMEDLKKKEERVASENIEAKATDVEKKATEKEKHNDEILQNTRKEGRLRDERGRFRKKGT